MGRTEKALLIAIMANLFLVGLKFFLAGISGSMALEMSGWHSVQGLFVSLAVFLGLILSRREGSRLTRGVSQIENVVALLISLFVFYLAYLMFYKMTSHHVHTLTNVPIVTLGAIFGASMCYMLSRFKIYVGQAAHSPSLVADGYHCRIHVVMEIAVIIGLAGYLVGFNNLDMLAAVVVTLFVLRTGWQLFSRALVSLTSKVSADYSCHITESGFKLGRPKKVVALGLVLLLAYISTGFYTVKWNEQAIVRRFGQKAGKEISPGFHYRLPWPIDSVERVNVNDIRRLETGSYLMLTGDENLIQLNVATHYQIKDASNYLFNLEKPEDLIRDATRTALRQVVGEMGIDSILTTARADILEKTMALTQTSLDRWDSGVHLVGVQLLQADPPPEVMEAFRDVASAREDRETYVNEAYGYLNSIVPEARGKAEKDVMEAQGFSAEQVNRANGNASRFLLQHGEHQKARKVTETRIYFESMEKILPSVEKIFINPDVKQGVMDLWFLGKDGKKTVIE
jgi:membrane protease subunit HflK